MNLSDSIRVLIHTQDPLLRRLPWHLWDFIERYPKTEIALSAPVSERIEVNNARHQSGVNILAVLGSSEDINVQADRESLVALPLLLGASAIALSSLPAEANFSLFSSPSDKQARGRVPGRRRGGARRGTCPETKTQLVALISAIEVETDTLPETYVGGITTAERPTFWFDVPYELTNELTAEFVLQDGQGQDIYRTTSAEFAAASQTPGIIGITPSSELTPLEIGRAHV